jgi:hypothetical protein
VVLIAAGWGGWAIAAAALAGAAAEEPRAAATGPRPAGGTLAAGGAALEARGAGAAGVPARGWPGAVALVCAAAASGRAMSQHIEKTFLSFIMFS